MENEGLLFTTANLGLVFVGLAAVVGIFRHVQTSGWTPQDMAGIRLMVEHGIAATAFSLLPAILVAEVSPEQSVWRASSFALASFLVFESIVNFRRASRLTREGRPPRYPSALAYAYFPLMVLVIVLEIANGVEWGSSSRYAVGVIWLLAAASVQLFHFLFPPNEGS